MGNEGFVWRLEILAGDDILRQERLTHGLRDELVRVDGLAVGFVDAGADAEGGRKGSAAGDVALWVTAAAAVRPASQVLIAVIKEWCARDRHRRVELTCKGATLTLAGRPDKAQERMIARFLDKVGEGEKIEEGDGAQ